MTDGPYRLLAPDEPRAAVLHRPDGASDIFLTCDHAGNLIPKRLNSLGLEPLDLARHIAWDVGAAGLSRRLSALLGATLVTQTYSRLVVDCNRTLDRPDAMAAVSEDTQVPGNLNLSAEEVEARAKEIYWPYHRTIQQALDAREAAGRASILFAVHSFTPVYHGRPRPWHIGLLYNRDTRLAKLFKEILAAEGDLCIGDNEPYAVSDETDYTIPIHGEQRGILNLEIEMRHDLIETVETQTAWAERLARWLTEALSRLRAMEPAL